MNAKIAPLPAPRAVSVAADESRYETGEQVALKRLFRMDAKSILRLKREFRSLIGINHPHIIKLSDMGRAHDGWFLTMEYVEGLDLTTYLSVSETAIRRTGGEVSLQRMLACFTQLARGIHALHQAGMLHRDLKPSNVLVVDHRVVVLDFGLVRELNLSAARLTEDGAVAGTLDGVIDALVRHLSHLDDFAVAHVLPPDLGALTRQFPVFERLSAVKHLLVRDKPEVEEASARDNRSLFQHLALAQALAEEIVDDCADTHARLDRQRDELPKNHFGIHHALPMSALLGAACFTRNYAWAHQCLDANWDRYLRSPVGRGNWVSIAQLEQRSVLGEVARDRYALGALLGGEQGRALTCTARGDLAALGVVNPPALLRAHYPEFVEAG